MDETSRTRARASHTRRETATRERLSVERRAVARLFLLSMGHDSSPSPSPTTARITRARAPWSLSAGRFVPWPPASASPPASIAHKIPTHRQSPHRIPPRVASTRIVTVRQSIAYPTNHRIIIIASSSYLSLGANDRARRARGLRRPAKRTKKVIRQSAPSSNGLERRASVALDRSHAPIAIREGPDRYARARPPWEKCARGRPRERRGARATHLTANTARVDIVCASMARGRRVVRTRARARGDARGLEAIDARWTRAWILIGGVYSCVYGVRS